jgi:RecA-family ATPase
MDKVASSAGEREREVQNWRSAIPIIDMANWDNEPAPEQEWAVPDRIPMRNASIFSGEGAAGKSLLQLQLSVACVLGKEWLGTMPQQGPALFIDAEDDEGVIHKRLADILRYYGARFADVKDNLHIVSLVGEDAVLGAVGTRKSGRIEATALYKRLLEMAGDLKPKIIGIASSADVFAGNEINRSQVKQFVAMMTKLAITANGGLSLISHPSLTGISTGTGLSGSTQWHNSVRARAYLESIKADGDEEGIDTNLRKITFKKNNYGPISASIGLKYQNGLFLPIDGETLDAAAKRERAKEVFTKILERFIQQNQKASAGGGVNYAPKLFAKEQEAKAINLSKEELALAMRTLLQTGAIVQENYGRPSNPHQRLVIGGNDGQM